MKAIFCLLALSFLIASAQGQEIYDVDFKRHTYLSPYKVACKIPTSVYSHDGVVLMNDCIAGMQEYNLKNTGIYVHLAQYADNYFVLKMLKNGHLGTIQWLRLYGKQHDCGGLSLIGIVISERADQAQRDLYVACAPSQAKQHAELCCGQQVAYSDMRPAVFVELQQLFKTLQSYDTNELSKSLEKQINDILNLPIESFVLELGSDPFFNKDVRLPCETGDIDVYFGIRYASYPYNEPTQRVLTCSLKPGKDIGQACKRTIRIFAEDCDNCLVRPMHEIEIFQETQLSGPAITCKETFSIEGRVLQPNLSMIPALKRTETTTRIFRSGYVSTNILYALQSAYVLIAKEQLHVNDVRVSTEAADGIKEALRGDIQFE